MMRPRSSCWLRRCQRLKRRMMGFVRLLPAFLCRCRKVLLMVLLIGLSAPRISVHHGASYESNGVRPHNDQTWRRTQNCLLEGMATDCNSCASRLEDAFALVSACASTNSFGRILPVMLIQLPFAAVQDYRTALKDVFESSFCSIEVKRSPADEAWNALLKL